MTTSIVIPHYGAGELLDWCLLSIAVHADGHELVVVDNGTGHRIAGDVVVRNASNAGFAVACNQGAAAASGDIVVFLNNDTEVHAGWLAPLVDAIEAGAGIAGSKLLYPDGTIQHSGIRLRRDAAGILVAENRHDDYPRGPVEAVTGACLAIRRDVFFKLGGFDPGYFNGYEDVDLCLTARVADHTVMYEPASMVTHHESSSGPARWVAVRQNIARLQARWVDYWPAEATT